MPSYNFPFTPAEKGSRWYGRRASDSKIVRVGKAKALETSHQRLGDPSTEYLLLWWVPAKLVKKTKNKPVPYIQSGWVMPVWDWSLGPQKQPGENIAAQQNPRAGVISNPERRNRGQLLDEYKLDVYDVDHKLAEEVAFRIGQGIQDAADLCQMTPPVCAGNLGVPRSSMPQLGDVEDQFLVDLQAEGVGVNVVAIPAGKLKATQRGIQAKKAHGMAQSMMMGGGWDPARSSVLVSSDNHILDGHHRWAALMLAAPHRGMKAVQIDMPIRQLLARSMRQPGVKRADLEGRPIPLDAPLDIPAAHNCNPYHHPFTRF